MRKAFGVAGAANHKPGATHFRYAWPSGDWGSLPIEGGLEVAYKAELAEFEGDALRRGGRRRSASGSTAIRSPFRSAEVFEIEEVIDPRETRPIAVPLGQPRRAVTPTRHHGLDVPPLTLRAFSARSMREHVHTAAEKLGP